MGWESKPTYLVGGVVHHEVHAGTTSLLSGSGRGLRGGVIDLHEFHSPVMHAFYEPIPVI